MNNEADDKVVYHKGMAACTRQLDDLKKLARSGSDASHSLFFGLDFVEQSFGTGDVPQLRGTLIRDWIRLSFSGTKKIGIEVPEYVRLGNCPPIFTNFPFC